MTNDLRAKTVDIGVLYEIIEALITTGSRIFPIVTPFKIVDSLISPMTCPTPIKAPRSVFLLNVMKCHKVMNSGLFITLSDIAMLCNLFKLSFAKLDVNISIVFTTKWKVLRNENVN